MRFFVHCEDEFEANALKEFESETVAAAFIEQRLAEATRPNAADYVVIRGDRLTVTVTAMRANIALT